VSGPGGSAAPGTPLQILLVDAAGGARDAVRLGLESRGLRVVVADTSARAIACLAEHAPDAVVANFDETLLPLLRNQPGMAMLPVLMLGDGGEGTRLHWIARGADEVLPAQVAADRLVATIRARVARARVPSARGAGPVESARRGGSLRRGQFLDQLGATLRDSPDEWQGLIALRVDQGKLLSESFGQAGAFELEQALAARFAPCLRQDDAYTLWMEFGFGILARRGSREEIEALAQALCASVASAPFEARGKSWPLTVSVGIALAPAGHDAGDPDRWFASAYAAEAIAHRLGGNRFDGVLSRDHGSLPPERVMIIREWVKEAVAGDNVLIEFQPVLPLQADLAGLYTLDAKLRDYRAPLAGVTRREYLGLARSAGALPMIDRMSLFSAFEAVEQERARGRATRVLVPMDLATVSESLLVWLDAEVRRRQAHSDGIIVEFDADMALGRPELVRVVQRLEDHGVAIAISDSSGGLARIAQLQRFPAGLLRLPISAIDSVPPERFRELLGPWRASGRELIADQVPTVEAVTRLFELKVSYVQGDALAAGGPRLDYEFTQLGA
jgi:EAL domain-containing protein (putative c-di-GMP-specific phosphodiesterase class I)/GGDEF domain-containing protein/CheY-like chemotaxis protein